MSALPSSRLRSAVLAATAAAVLATGVLVIALVFLSGQANVTPRVLGAPQQDDEKPDPAPDLDGGTAWLNTAGPIRLKDLRGKFVLLDFWTFCCINCIHTLPDLHKLEKKYANQLVVIGVHSAKFDEEKDSEAIRKAVLRYEIEHPVVNDSEMKIWRKYRARAWPTLALIDPEGNHMGNASGEGNFELIDKILTQEIPKYRDKKLLNEKPIKFELARFSESGNSPLFFPGKVLADQASNRLFIADSTHHRIVITDLEGKKIAVVGLGKPDNVDGPPEKACFNDPQGMAVKGDTLFVADRKNHLVRGINLKTFVVKTIAGTGEQGKDRRRGGGPLAVGLNSPWDLTIIGDDLFICQAGFHQIWKLDLKENDLRRYAGTGREDIEDGTLRLCSLAQPSGLTSDGKTLYVADSESSTVRSMPADGTGEVTTLIGIEGDGLFNFGDTDGEGKDVRLQHALGVTWHDGKVYIADTYNSKIKVLNPRTRTCRTLLGGDKDGWLGGPLLAEPCGLSVAGDRLYVADTNAHRIRVYDLKSKKLSTLRLEGVEAPKVQ